jgi:hypothetical protein
MPVFVLSVSRIMSRNKKVEDAQFAEGKF